MAEENQPSENPGPENAQPGAEERPHANGQDVAQPQAAAEDQEGGTKSILRDAIQKVMAEIEHHEQEAQKHLQQAAALRKELRESIAFLREQGEKGKPQGSPAAGADQGAAHLPAAGKHAQAHGKKKGPGKKSR